MSTLEDKARAAKEHLTTQTTDNPASRAGSTLADGRKRVPMTLPTQRLAVPEIPGYHTHWMLSNPDRIQQALNAGYEFVEQAEVAGKLSVRLIGGKAEDSTSSDMGSRVSTLANPTGGGDLDGGQPARLILMKQKLEWYEEDQRLLQARNDSVVDALTASFRGGVVGGKADGETNEDLQQRYVGLGGGRQPVKIPELFRRKGPGARRS